MVITGSISRTYTSLGVSSTRVGTAENTFLLGTKCTLMYTKYTETLEQYTEATLATSQSGTSKYFT